MKVPVRSYLLTGFAVASCGVIAVTPVVLPLTPYGIGIANAQPDNDDSTDQTDRSGATRSTSPGRVATRTPTQSSVEPSNDDTGTSVAGQTNRGARSRLSAVSGSGQTSTDGQGTTVRLPSRVTAGAEPRATNDIRSFGVSRNRVTVTANGSIRPHTQVGVTGISATAASAPDTAAAPSPGRTINAAVQRALAGQTSATVHASANARATSTASPRTTIGTQRAPTDISAAQPARSSSPYAGNR